MKTRLPMLLGLLVTSCAVLQSTPWDWLDDPEQQAWRGIEIEGYERTIGFSVPDKAGKGGQHVIRWPEPEDGLAEQAIGVGHDPENRAWHQLIKFSWEWFWGGPLKEDEIFYTLTVAVQHRDQLDGLLDLTIGERIQKEIDFQNAMYDEVEKHGQPLLGREWFFERYEIEPFRSKQNYQWFKENIPQLVKEHERFVLPISDRHELVFWFWYHWQEDGGKTDPAWLERRKRLSRQILDTVEITPDPRGLKQSME